MAICNDKVVLISSIARERGVAGREEEVQPLM